MTEQDKMEYCKLWIEARDLAQDKGLTMSLVCPMDEVCTGEKCVFVDPKKRVTDIIYSAPYEGVKVTELGC